MRYLALILSVVFISAAPVLAEEKSKWQHLFSFEGKGEVSFNQEALRHSEGIALVWVKWSYHQPQLIEEGQVDELRERMYINCSTLRSRMQNSVFLFRGKTVIAYGATKKMEWDDLPPESEALEIAKKVCHFVESSKPKTESF